AHGRHHAFVERRLADHVTHVKRAGGNFHEHMLTEDFEVFHTHCAILQPQPRYVALGASERRVAPLGNVGETCSAFHRQLSRIEQGTQPRWPKKVCPGGGRPPQTLVGGRQPEPTGAPPKRPHTPQFSDLTLRSSSNLSSAISTIRFRYRRRYVENRVLD